MERDELAFAGAVRQAEMVRRGEVSSRELVELYLDRIARFDRELNAFRMVLAERALADAAAGRRAARRGRRAPAARRADRRSRTPRTSRGEVTALGHRPPTAARRQRDNEVVRAAARGRRGDPRQDQPARAGDHAASRRAPAFGDHAQPVEHRPHARAARAAAAPPRWRPGCARRRTASDGAGSIRIPAACCGLVGLKPQRDRISLAPRERALVRARASLGFADPHGGGHGAAARRRRGDPPERLYAEARGAPAAAPADRDVAQDAVPAGRRSTAAVAARSRRSRSGCARWATRWSSTTRTTAGPPTR